MRPPSAYKTVDSKTHDARTNFMMPEFFQVIREVNQFFRRYDFNKSLLYLLFGF